jgi:molybdopterin/thiamine biosynthesis adenylyltransferase
MPFDSRYEVQNTLVDVVSSICQTLSVGGLGSPAALYLAAAGAGAITLVGRCRLTVSKPVLKAPMGSALEPIIS